MDKFKRIIIILSVVIFILIILLIAIKSILKKKNEGITDTETGNYVFRKEDVKEEDIIKQKNLIDKLDYFTVSKCMQQFLKETNKNNSIYYMPDEKSNADIFYEDEMKEHIYGYLSEKYIREKNITKENVLKYIDVLDKEALFVPVNMVQLQKEDDIRSYLLYGIIENMNDYTYIKDIYAIINLNTNNLVYSVEILNEKYNDISDVKVKTLENVVNKTYYNTYTYPKITDEQTIKNYIDIYKRLALAKPELAYKYLNDEYRTKRFSNLSDFEEYLKQNRNEIISLALSKYKVNDLGNAEKEYIVLNNQNQYIIFYEKSATEFDVVLDSYTVLTNDAKVKYDNANDKQKVEINLGKFIEALNTKDYKYIYDHLDDGYKTNNFKTIDELKKYIHQNFYAKNSIELLEYDKQGEIYVYSLRLKNMKNASESKQLKVALKILEDREFVMSFNI